jgi:hypothetical protein
MIVVRFGPLAARVIGLAALAVVAFSGFAAAIHSGVTSLTGWQAVVVRVAVAVFLVGTVTDTGVWRAVAVVVRGQPLDRRSRQLLGSLTIAGLVAGIAPLQIRPRTTADLGLNLWFALALVTLVTSFVTGLLAPGIVSMPRRRRVFVVGLLLTVAGVGVLVTPLYPPNSIA